VNTLHKGDDDDDDDDDDRGNCIDLAIIQKIPDQHTGKARNQGTTNNSDTGHCTHTAGSANVKVLNILHEKLTLRTA
jgi:hypothetical protein